MTQLKFILVKDELPEKKKLLLFAVKKKLKVGYLLLKKDGLWMDAISRKHYNSEQITSWAYLPTKLGDS